MPSPIEYIFESALSPLYSVDCLPSISVLPSTWPNLFFLSLLMPLRISLTSKRSQKSSQRRRQRFRLYLIVLALI